MIYIENQQEEIIMAEAMLDLLRKALEAGLRMEAMTEEVELSLVLVDSAEIQALNAEYRGLDKPTDVLSFAAEEGSDEFLLPEELPFRLLGDIVIAVPIAAEQAAVYGHSFEREMAFLALHGLLHLLGYDHGHEEDDSDLADMVQRQEIVLNQLGLERCKSE